jgi:MFS family permease
LGASIACFGLLHAFAQAFIAGRLTRRWGERAAILTGVSPWVGLAGNLKEQARRKLGALRDAT